MEGFAGWGQGREKKGGIEEKQREGTGSLDSWFLRGLSLSREHKKSARCFFVQYLYLVFLMRLGIDIVRLPVSYACGSHLREAGKICGWWGDTLWSERNGGGAGGDFGAILIFSRPLGPSLSHRGKGRLRHRPRSSHSRKHL